MSALNPVLALLSVSLVLDGTGPLQSQAGRYIPIRLPGGGGGGEILPHIPFFAGQGCGEVFWVLMVVGGVIWWVSLASRKWFGDPDQGPAEGVRGTLADPPTKPDLILAPSEVAGKAEQTERLLEQLARQDRAFDPGELRRWVGTTFDLVQQAWEARDYDTVRDRLMPGILAEHQGLLQSMRNNHEINRVSVLRVERLEFVHLSCPRRPDLQEVTVLITFRACVYFVDDRTGQYRRGSQVPECFQEFWTFRRQGDRWLLLTIERSHASDRLRRANVVADLPGQQAEV